MTLADLGSLFLLRALARRLYGQFRAQELAWIYAFLPLPLVFTFWTFDALLVFWLFLAIWCYLSNQGERSAGALVLGTLTKYTPLLFLLAAWRDRRPGAPSWFRIAALTVISLALVYAALLAGNAEMTAASLQSQLNKPPYQSIWALIAGRFTTGIFGPLPSHLDAAAATGSYVPLIPAALRWGTCALVLLLSLARRNLSGERALLAATGFGLLCFALFAQGFSPQWLLPILPLILLVFPTRQGLLTLLILSVLALVDYPLIFARSGPVITESWRALFTATVLLREGLLLALCIAFYRQLR